MPITYFVKFLTKYTQKQQIKRLNLNVLETKKALKLMSAFLKIEKKSRLEIFRNSNIKCLTKIEVKVINVWSVIIIT